MTAFFSALIVNNFFCSTAINNDDGFWEEPSTIKTRLTAQASYVEEHSTCGLTAASALATKHSLADRRQKSYGLTYAAPSA